jgi:uncharacterized protein
MDKLRLLITSDIHGDSSQASKLAKRAEEKKADLVIIAGDISYFDEHAKGVIGPFLNHGREVVFVPGNHDLATTKWVEDKYRIKNLQKTPVRKKNVGFFGCGGANVGINLLDEDEIYEYLEKGFNKIKDSKKKVMVTHVHPSGSEIEKFSSFEGSSAVRRAIKKFKPDIHICGHIHEAEGMEEVIYDTKVMCTGKKGKIIDI